MKSLKKIFLLVSAVGLLGFYMINTQAASIQDHHPLIQPQSNLVVAITLPQLNVGGASYSNNLISTIRQDSIDPRSTQNKTTTTGTCQSNKVNEVYELTALFNDKLQLLLSYFSTQKNKHTDEDKAEDKESIQVVSWTPLTH